MGLFDFLKKNQPKRIAKFKIEMTAHVPTREEMASQWKNQTAERIRNFQKDKVGLYPHEILMLSYLEKYSLGKEPAKFWERDYGVDDVPALISSLEQRGFAKEGKLTETGKDEIKRNEYVLYMHRHKIPDISMSRMSILVNQNPAYPYRDLLWAEFNRLALEYTNNHQWGLYRNIKLSMYKFTLEEKKYINALPLLAEVFLYDLNGSASPFIAPALIEQIRNLERKIDYTDEKMIDTLQSFLKNMYAPYKNYSTDEVICIIVAYAFGHDEIAEKIFNRYKKKR